MPSRVTLPACFLCLCATAGAMLWPPADAALSPWQGTGIDFSSSDKRLNDGSCRRSKGRFLSCVGAFQGILDLYGRDLHLVPVSDLTKSNSSRKIVARFGAAAVVEDRSLRVNSEGNALEVLRTRSHRIVRWRDWLGSGRPQGVHFTAMREWIRDEIVDPDRTEEFAAAAINGYLGVADAHARVAPASTLQGGTAVQRGANRSVGSNGSVYIGIGAGVQPMIDAALVTSVVREGPAANAGLRTQDFILAVDGEAVAGLTAESLVERLRGENGTQVRVTVKRQDEIKTMLIRRDLVRVNNVVAFGFVDRGWQFIYLKIDSFLQNNTCNEVRRALARQLKPNLNGLILDLRDNPGGLIDQAVCVADLFLPEAEVVLEIRDVREKRRSERIRTRGDARVRVPMVTLVNANTGSASEVLAGALQDHGRAPVVGELTFGKGTVQTARPWPGSRSIMEFFTVARYYRPSGVGVQLIGIEPDIPAAEIPETGTRARVVLREGDFFPTALARERRIWEHPDPDTAAALRACTIADGLATHRLQLDAEEGRVTDYPLAVAKDALVCRLNRRL